MSTRLALRAGYMGGTQITVSGTLLPSLTLTILLVILETEVFIAFALAVAVAAIIPRSP